MGRLRAGRTGRDLKGGLEIGEREPGYVDAYYGPAEWKTAAEANPRSVAELQSLVREQPYEVLHIALSDAFEREDRLASLAGAIREVRRASVQPQLQVLVSGRAFAMQPGLAVVVGADGDGLAQGSDAPDLEAMLAWARIRRQSPGMMVAQSMINGLALSLQRKRFGEAPPDLPADTAPDR